MIHLSKTKQFTTFIIVRKTVLNNQPRAATKDYFHGCLVFKIFQFLCDSAVSKPHTHI